MDLRTLKYTHIYYIQYHYVFDLLNFTYVYTHYLVIIKDTVQCLKILIIILLSTIFPDSHGHIVKRVNNSNYSNYSNNKSNNYSNKSIIIVI